MEEAADEFKIFLQGIRFLPLQIPVLSNVTGLPYHDHRQLAERLSQQLVSAVRWTDCLSYMHKQGVRHFIEIGSGTVLSGLTKQTLLDAAAHSIQVPADFEEATLLFQDAVPSQKG
jgi:[acyl-carrier-protein] S-malonyltransferase